MQRRTFNKQLLFGLAACGLGLRKVQKKHPARRSIKPPRLKKGDTIGLITPGSYISDEGLEKAVKNVEELGFRVKLSRNIRKKRGYTAGTDAERLDDLQHMFSDAQVKAVWCARGGYGSARLLPMLNFKQLKKQPKALIGYSDITALLNALYSQTGLIGFHGPVASSEMTDYTKEQLLAVLMYDCRSYTIKSFRQKQEDGAAENSAPIRCLQGGNAKGRLLGGNLSLLAALAGTPWAPDYRSKIVFLEDVGEKPYRIDRMLTQLRQASALPQAAAFALGTFSGCEAEENDNSLSLEQTLEDRIASLKKPCSHGLSFGHIKQQCTLPIGLLADFDAETGDITLGESATAA